MLRCIFCGYCQEVCPEEAIFLMNDYSLISTNRQGMVYSMDRLLALGGVHYDQTGKWKKAAAEATEAELVPLKTIMKPD
jgi:NADH-quinone oxidoreductase subunit I